MTWRAAWPVPRSRVYAIVAVVAGLIVAAPAGGQLPVSVDPVMTKGAADAPVTIVEFSDYQ
jgi:protein-disulfide isomerase